MYPHCHGPVDRTCHSLKIVQVLLENNHSTWASYRRASQACWVTGYSHPALAKIGKTTIARLSSGQFARKIAQLCRESAGICVRMASANGSRVLTGCSNAGDSPGTIEFVRGRKVFDSEKDRRRATLGNNSSFPPFSLQREVPRGWNLQPPGRHTESDHGRD